jgi:CubicO group peptidase (beta-lactamase class C family)
VSTEDGSVSPLKWPGSALVIRDGSVLHSAGAPDAAYPVASVSKQFVAAAVALSAARGLLAFDDPVARWIGPWAAGITVHQLLTHTSGLGHWDAVGDWSAFSELDPVARLDAIRSSEPVGAPGERWSYSGLGFLLLAGVVERATGVRYGEFAATELFAPAGMAATSSGGPGLRSLPGTGDVVSTVADLVRWPPALPRLLEPSVLWTPRAELGAGAYSLPVVTADAYGYGCFVGTIAGRPAVFHPGDLPGHQSLLAVIPSTATVVAVLLADETVRLSEVVAALVPYLD